MQGEDRISCPEGKSCNKLRNAISLFFIQNSKNNSDFGVLKFWVVSLTTQQNYFVFYISDQAAQATENAKWAKDSRASTRPIFIWQTENAMLFTAL